MGKELTHKQFLYEWSKRIPGPVFTLKRLEFIYRAFVDTIYDELKQHNKLILKNLGTLSTKESGGYDKFVHFYKRKMYIEPYLIPQMKFSDNLKAFLRADGDSSEFAQRLKKRYVRQSKNIEKTNAQKHNELIDMLATMKETGKGVDETLEDKGKKRKGYRGSQSEKDNESEDRETN